ncbi:peroxisome biogenesis protein 1 [Monomorium pharaonis]|uniref:peroxisome biogenesis protein 1 n=1 Tax=Monomorium pharaonis TaxID=307658 RepID=UPI00063F4DAC|nr:peroxisome biogenesis protein 1 [Monomorium pharaonis]
MRSERFIVKYITTNNCFAHLSISPLRRLESKENAIEILHNKKTYYLSCVGCISVNDDVLSIGATFARSLNIQEGDEVRVSSVKKVPSLSSIHIVPRTASDRELLELQMEKMQSSLLSQVRIVAKGQPIVAWISKFSSVTFSVADTEPRFAYGMLEEFTEVHVLDASADTMIKDAEEARKIGNSLARILPYFAKGKDNRDSGDCAANYALLPRFRNRTVPCVFRAYPLPDFPSCDKSNAYDIILRCPSNILIRRDCLPKGAKSNGKMICKVRKVSKDRTNRTNFLTTVDSSFKPPQELVARIYVLEDILDKCSASLDRDYFDLNSIHSCAYMSLSLSITLDLEAGCRVIVQMIEEVEPPKPSSINIFLSHSTIASEFFFENYLKLHSRHEPLLLNADATIPFDDGECIIRMSPADCNYVIVTRDIINSDVLINLVPPPSGGYREEIFEKCFQKNTRMEKISTRYIEGILKDCKTVLDLSLGLRRVDFQYDRENILICGNVGSGKTTICNKLIECYKGAPYFVYTTVIECRLLRGKKAETIQKTLTHWMKLCVYYQPSILFLDDLECITNASLNDEKNTIDATNDSRVTDMLINTIMQYQESHYISVVATCVDVSKIGLRLRPARGAQFFKTVLQIPNLEKVDRIDILRLTLEDKLCVPGDMNWNYYGNKTEGWMPQDLVDLTEKSRFVAWKRHVKGRQKAPIIMTEEDVNTALEGCTPMSLQGVQLYKSGGHSWSDIGGLADTKSSLTEILQWPLKYPEIFKNAPIKLQSGVLLYGMPGTGKTMLAKAIAGECGVNLISIKGPELLSKYIGVSEESVRDVFERARRAKPCVLFFDEFDSLAPRRGHDNTGATDRVVNQLLTQLDGVEDREGVAVVAASSRPDLLDPALLRPGRLDKCLHCPLPNELEREEIFKVLCNSQNIDVSELNLKVLVQLSDGFTGADINAAITLARLSAFEVLAAATDGKVNATAIKVTQTQLVESIRSTRPSLSTAEKLKYTKIYARFSNEANLTEDELKNQKMTLA